MCGFLVTVGREPFHHRMIESLRRRGPDAIGFWSDANASGGNVTVNLAHARLAVVGLDARGTGPLENEQHVLAYNGEIYNFTELGDKLGKPGASDSEVLLEGWTRRGESFLAECSGIWAFTAYDKRARRIDLVRDQLGTRPLYYCKTPDRFVAASTLGALLAALGAAPALDWAALSEYVRYQLTFGDHTFLAGVRKVMPGQIVSFSVDSREITTRTYEDIFKTSNEPLTPEWTLRARELLHECALESTVGDTSFTSLCSGGLDSSAVTRITDPEVAYHGNYSDPECNETFFAEEAVRGTGTRLLVVNAREDLDLVERLRSIVEDFDELGVGSVILPLDDVLAQVRRRYKVVLTGTGGDELFGGYVRYQLAQGVCLHEPYRNLFQRMERLVDLDDRFELAHRKGDSKFYRFYDRAAETSFREAFAASGNDVGAMLTFDRRYFLAALLNIDDRMGGRHGLESRPSLLHQRLVRHVARLDPYELLRGDDLKSVGREILGPSVPPSVSARRDKMGFTTPIGTFVNRASGRIREEIATSPFRELYDLRGVNMTAKTKFSREIFGLLLLDLWLKRYASPPSRG